MASLIPHPFNPRRPTAVNEKKAQKKKKAPKICTQKELPAGAHVDASLRRAAAVTNTAAAAVPLRAAFETARLWPNGSVLTVRFLGGSGAQQSFVKRVAAKWSEFANITFRFLGAAAGAKKAQAHIRVAFATNDGSWSYVGTDALGIPQRSPTLNLGWLDKRRPADEGVVLHEFGHALGLVHEHQLPTDGGMQWNRDAVIADLSGPPNNWDLATIESNVFDKYTPEQLSAAQNLDPTSIMMYSFPATWTLNNVATPMNEQLSDTDKATAALVYPK